MRPDISAITRRLSFSRKGWAVNVYGQAELFREWLDSAAEDMAALLAYVAELESSPDIIVCRRCRHETGPSINCQFDEDIGVEIGTLCRCDCHSTESEASA